MEAFATSYGDRTSGSSDGSCLPSWSRQFTLLDVAASVGHGEVKIFGNHRDETIVKTEKTNFEKLKLRYSGHGILGTQFHVWHEILKKGYFWQNIVA